MATSTTPTIANLRRAIEIAEQIEKLQAELVSLVGVSTPSSTPTTSPKAPKKAGKRAKRQLSPEARKRIADAQKARWAKVRSNSKPAPAKAKAKKK